MPHWGYYVTDTSFDRGRIELGLTAVDFITPNPYGSENGAPELDAGGHPMAIPCTFVSLQLQHKKRKIMKGPPIDWTSRSIGAPKSVVKRFWTS